MKYILTTIALFFSLLAAGQLWYTPVDTIVPGTRDTVPIQAVIVCPGMETPRFKNISREMVWDFPDVGDLTGIYFINRWELVGW